MVDSVNPGDKVTLRNMPPDLRYLEGRTFIMTIDNFSESRGNLRGVASVFEKEMVNQFSELALDEKLLTVNSILATLPDDAARYDFLDNLNYCVYCGGQCSRYCRDVEG